MWRTKDRDWVRVRPAYEEILMETEFRLIVNGAERSVTCGSPVPFSVAASTAGMTTTARGASRSAAFLDRGAWEFSPAHARSSKRHLAVASAPHHAGRLVYIVMTVFPRA